MDQSFNKEERLRSKKIIDLLFDKGVSFSFDPIRTIYLETEHKSGFPVQVLIAVPKKNIPKAVDRNKVKRRMREAYRKNKSILAGKLKNNDKSLAIALVYNERKVRLYSEIEDKIILSLQRLAK